MILTIYFQVFKILCRFLFILRRELAGYCCHRVVSVDGPKMIPSLYAQTTFHRTKSLGRVVNPACSRLGGLFLFNMYTSVGRRDQLRVYP